jgi:hypothetical protein
MLIATVVPSIARAQEDIVFDDAFNFREFRINPPLNFEQGPDLFQLGIDVIDNLTGARPPGATVGAKNLNTEEIFPLSVDGPVEYFTFVPYSTDRANGDWLIEVESNVGIASALVPAFGTGPGTGAIPGVDNLSIVPGALPVFSWVLPANLPTLNDGNIDRIRARIFDSNSRRIFDSTIDTSLTATSFTVPSGVITHNGAFVGQIMIEGFNPFNRSRTFEPFVVDDVGTGGEPVSHNPFYFRDNRQVNSVRFGEGDLLTVGSNVSPFNDTFVYAQNGGEVVTLSQAREANRQFEFGASFDYDAGLTGSWDLVAWNGAVESIVQTHVVGAAELLPFVRNVRILPDFLTPTFEWDLPLASPPFTNVQIGLFDDVTDERLSVFGPGQDQLFETLPLDATSFKFAPGALEEGRKYVVRILLINQDIFGNTVTRSLSFFNFTPIMATSSEPVFLPTLDESGVYLFDFDVTKAVPVVLDPLVAIGYEYAIGEGDPRFATVELPLVGDGVFDLVLFDSTGAELPAIQLPADVPFDFTLVDPLGVDRFVVLGIEESALLDPGDTTAFMTTVSFMGDGRFTGSMTPITSFVGTAATIDIRPDSDRNRINTKSKGVVPVALVGRTDLDATTFVAVSASFGPAAAPNAHDLSKPSAFADHVKDVTGDGIPDLVLHFRQELSGLDTSDTEACVTVRTTTTVFSGCDSVDVFK